MSQIDPRDFRNALGQFATGVTVITTRDDQGRPVGVTASSFNSVSLDPPLVLWSLDKSAASLKAFSDYGYFSVHVLAEGQESLSNNFARRGEDKFSGVDLETGVAELPVLPECAARFQCQLIYQYDGGDHTILVGEVKEYKNFQRKPLIFHSGQYAKARPGGNINATRDTVLDFSRGHFTSDFLGYLISRAHFQLHLPLVESARAEGLEEIHYFILSALCIKHEMALSELAAFLAHTGQVPTLADCQKMQDQGLLTITDTQASSLKVTEAGERTYMKLLAGDVSRSADALSDFSPEELSDLIGYLRQIIEKTNPGVPDLWS
jgi:3-hydroxy-9,10-secoandrosta-1,3,5(10)-triene-9,17-dione monooxygenase reductase component